MKGFLRLLASLAAVALCAPAVRSEESHPVTIELRSFFYGDNTEFLSNPYVDGGTLLGEQLRLSATVTAAKNVRLRLGVRTDTRAGDSEKFHSIWPVIALEVGGPTNTFIMGSLRSGALDREPSQGLWPDESGPHQLVPPLHLDTLTMTQTNEAGLQWVHASNAFANDLWISWRQLNTDSQREKFDVGFNSRLALRHLSRGSVAMLAQGHVVHIGGQYTHVGMVGDSLAGGLGVHGEHRIGAGILQAEGLALFSKHNPDRGDHTRADHLNGHGVFIRAAYELKHWRGAWLFWRGRDLIKWDGDPNYGALLNDDQHPFPQVTRAMRTYHEFSMSRRFVVGDSVAFLANGRLYRVDQGWDYAYRVAASIRLRRVFGGGK